jgi:transcriptional regulator with XRE-family HTH domain
MRKDILNRFGSNVQKFRKKKGLSQEELAEKCGLHRTYIGGIERGERNVSLINLNKLAKALGVKVSKLVER